MLYLGRFASHPILLLLGICFWLIYQIKYSHDKKRELNDQDSKTSVKEDINDSLKLGRKDLRVKHREENDEDHKHSQTPSDFSERRNIRVNPLRKSTQLHHDHQQIQ